MIFGGVAGFAMGIFATFDFQYRWKPRMRVGGFPLPVVFFILEDDHWTDFLLPGPIEGAATITNLLMWISIFLGLWKLVLRVTKKG